MTMSKTMTRTQATWMTVAFGALALAACAVERAPVEGTAHQAIEECPDWACGQNGPLLNGHYFHELSESRAPNHEGFSISGSLMKNGLAYHPSVSGMQLRASSRVHGTLTGQQLIGAYFDIAHDSGKRYRVFINGQSTMQIFAGPMKGSMVPQYILEWIEVTPGAPPDHYHNLCSNPPTGAYRQETLFQQGESTLFFEGTRYNAATKEVLFGDSNWFNLGCAGSALSKLLLTGHTNLTGAATQPQQQTVLKMLTADYCGDGKSFTVAGEPLYWKTQNGYMSFVGQPTSFEARWNADGPVCLDTARLVDSDLQAAKDNFPLAADGTPGVEAAMLAHCPATLPPACNALPANYDFAGAFAVSANPPL
jgi:ADYC domain